MGNEGKNNSQYKHGYCLRKNVHPLYLVWAWMKSRCLNKNDTGYMNYGGRGISIHQEWADNSDVFIKWCLENGWSRDLQIDRFDNDGDYTPDNCRFVTGKQNAKNKRLLYSSNKTGYAGVHHRKSSNRYHASVNKKYIGSYSNPLDAAVARDSFVISNNLGLNLNFKQPVAEIKS